MLNPQVNARTHGAQALLYRLPAHRDEANAPHEAPTGHPVRELTADALQMLHLNALREGKARHMVNLGDAEGLLWEAPSARVLQRLYPLGSEMRALLGTNGLPVAWWQRYVAAPLRNRIYRLPYEIANQSIHAIESHVPRERGTSHAQHGFCAETFVDEMAQAAGQDSYEYRRALLPAGSRHRRVLDAVAQHAGWGDPLPARHGRGMALVETDGAIAAEVIEASIGTDGQPRAHRVVAVIDCGSSAPSASASLQAEMAILMGLDAALASPIAPAQRPRIELHFLASDVPACEHPETALSPVAPALANAFFAATGERVRALPIATPTAGSGATPPPRL